MSLSKYLDRQKKSISKMRNEKGKNTSSYLNLLVYTTHRYKQTTPLKLLDNSFYNKSTLIKKTKHLSSFPEDIRRHSEYKTNDTPDRKELKLFENKHFQNCHPSIPLPPFKPTPETTPSRFSKSHTTFLRVNKAFFR